MSIGAAVFGTILVVSKRTRAHEHGAPGIESRDGMLPDFERTDRIGEF